MSGKRNNVYGKNNAGNSKNVAKRNSKANNAAMKKAACTADNNGKDKSNPFEKMKSGFAQGAAEEQESAFKQSMMMQNRKLQGKADTKGIGVSDKEINSAFER